MRMDRIAASLLLLACTGSLAIACGDDDDGSKATPSEDAGTTPDGGSPNTTDGDGSAPKGDAGDADAEAPGFAPITPSATVRLPNAANPYGLCWASDGNLYASGATVEGGTRKLAVWRFKDGALDTTFGNAGVLTTDLDGNESSFDIVEVSAGNFVVHATTPGKVWLVRMVADQAGVYGFGAPKFVRFGYDEDEGWQAGSVNPPAAAPAYTSWGIGLDKSVAASPKIVVFAHGAPAKSATPETQRYDNDRWITRVDANTLEFDTNFNNGAPYTADADDKGLADNARRGLVLADGSIVSAGYTNFEGTLLHHVVLIRLKPNGTVDEGFGFGTSGAGIPGQTKFNPFLAVGGNAEAYGVVRQKNGYYVTTGYGNSNATGPSKNVDLVSVRAKPDGLDTTWGKLGAVAWQSEPDKSAGLGAAPYTDRGRDLAVLPDDRTVHAGVYDDFATLFVLDPNGKPDTSFGAGGMLEYNYPMAFFKVAVSPDGKKIAATAQSIATNDVDAPNASLLVTLDVGN